ncbi:hypothetical protein CA3LBN_001096 [Candidozyma haemuli]|uniref:Calnexin n=1 Tax=Candidozyma haemuli TaxID=45357 RepID=A0ABX8I6R2_9ASCO|nr:hypothetical protein CA3LBN_001096 [[Candida] haemuloni]
MKFSHLALLSASAVTALAEQFVPFDQSQLQEDSFLEQFDYPSLLESGWVPSQSQKSGPYDYFGKWKIADKSKYQAFENEKGLLMAKEAAYYAISKKLPQTFVKGGNGDLVVQFEVKFQEGVSCSGGYIKLLSEGTIEEEFSDRTPFEVMFGPDICGSESKVHFIVRKHDEESGEMVEHRLKRPPMARNNVLTNLYTLVFRADGSTEIRLNGDVAKAGNAFTSSKFMDPPLSEPEYIEDKTAKKPDDWDDEFFIPDPEAVKPDDWDEVYGSPWIPDPAVKKPDGWNDDPAVPSSIPNPKATKPAMWLEEEDGEWTPPMMRNPECLHGCGEWKAPEVPNPKYKGIWTAPSIQNPNYMGVWRTPKIKNPRFGNEDHSHLIGPIDALGFELWTMTQGVLFTNVYLGRSVEEAERIGNDTFVPKQQLEWDSYKANKPKPEHDAKPPPPTFEDYLDEDSENLVHDAIQLIVLFYKSLYNDAMDYWADFQADPAIAISQNPVKFAVYCAIGAVGLTVVFVAVNVAMFVALQAKNAAGPTGRNGLTGDPNTPATSRSEAKPQNAAVAKNEGGSAKTGGTQVATGTEQIDPVGGSTGASAGDVDGLRKRAAGN